MPQGQQGGRKIVARIAALDIAACDSVDAIARIVEQTSTAYGMSASAGGMVTGPIAHSDQPFFFTNWPDFWLQLYAERGYLQKDPIPRWAIVSGAPTAWSDLLPSLPHNDPGHDVFAVAAQYGYREGLVVPVRSFTGALGLVSAGGDRGRLAPAEVLDLHQVFTAAILRAETLTLPHRVPTASPLTLRERECTSLLVQGFGDQQIAATLGISAETVRFHLDNARRKLGARSRAQLAAIAAGSAGKPA